MVELDLKSTFQYGIIKSQTKIYLNNYQITY